MTTGIINFFKYLFYKLLKRKRESKRENVPYRKRITPEELKDMTVGQFIDLPLYHRELEVLMNARTKAYKNYPYRTPIDHVKDLGAWNVDSMCEIYKAIIDKSCKLPRRVRDEVERLCKIAYIKTFKQLQAECSNDAK